MKIDLGNAVIFEVTFAGKTYPLREPTVKDISLIQGVASDANANVFVDFVIGLGLPKDVADQLGITKLKKLADGLLSELQEKK